MATKHTCGGPVFGKLTAGCARCDELKAGAAPVQWQDARRAQQQARELSWIRSHDCKASRCSVVCTFGDW